MCTWSNLYIGLLYKPEKSWIYPADPKKEPHEAYVRARYSTIVQGKIDNKDPFTYVRKEGASESFGQTLIYGPWKPAIAKKVFVDAGGFARWIGQYSANKELANKTKEHGVDLNIE